MALGFSMMATSLRFVILIMFSSTIFRILYVLHKTITYTTDILACSKEQHGYMTRRQVMDLASQVKIMGKAWQLTYINFTVLALLWITYILYPYVENIAIKLLQDYGIMVRKRPTRRSKALKNEPINALNAKFLDDTIKVLTKAKKNTSRTKAKPIPSHTTLKGIDNLKHEDWEVVSEM